MNNNHLSETEKVQLQELFNGQILEFKKSKAYSSQVKDNEIKQVLEIMTSRDEKHMYDLAMIMQENTIQTDQS